MSSRFAYQWTRDGVDIPGATSYSYVITEADLGHRISRRGEYLKEKEGEELFINWESNNDETK